jgi:hypothetical protein
MNRDTKLGLFVGLVASIFSSIIGLDPFNIKWWICTIGLILVFWIIWYGWWYIMKQIKK